MCGIAGFYGFRNDNLIKKISKELQHRGPDGEGYAIDDTVTLLNRRLAIIDRKGGDQPIYNEEKTDVIDYNGEIYNYRELRAALEKAGHQFTTHSDTEVIVHGYEEWGEASFDRYNGMFALALYDKKKEKLILARDHFGIKPLYYSFTKTHVIASNAKQSQQEIADNTIIFSSEIKPIIQSGLILKEPNDRIIYRYLMYRVHDDQEETFFKGVYKLMPGQMMILDKKGFEKKYFSDFREELLRLTSEVEERSGKTSEVNAGKEFKDKLIEAIKLRLISEVPVGTCLSGGLDSSTVASIVNKLLKEKVAEASSVGKHQNTFSAVFPQSSNDEERYVDTLLKQLKNVRSHKVYPKPEEFFQELEDFIRTQEEPTISTGPYAQYKVMQEAHKYVTVLLDGQGADEMMAGYLPYYFVYLNQIKKRGKYFLLLKEIVGAKDVLLKYAFRRLLTDLGIRKDVPARQLLQDEFVKQYANENFTITNDNLKQRLIEDIFHNSLPSLLRYEDKNSMRFSIEGRVPFLDFNLLHFLFQLPDEAIIKDGWNKAILRQSTTDLIPELIRRRRNKIGFTTPEYEWFLRMKNRIYSLFLTESFTNRKYFKQSEVLKAFEEFIKGKNDDTMMFWRMLNLEFWFQIFFDQASAKVTAGKAKRRSIFSPNPQKELKINIDGKVYVRFPVHTDVIQKGDVVSRKVIKYTNGFLNQLLIKSNFRRLHSKEWFVVLSEKIVAIAQGRSYFIWDINPGFWAKTLASFVTKTPYGIGLGSPWTMQLAINEVGTVRILFAATVASIAKLFGAKGLFYTIAGGNIRAIDGPTEYSLYPSNVSAKLPPKNPKKVAKILHEELAKSLSKTKLRNFKGVVIIDANDLGRNVLGNSTGYKNELIENIFRDNPMGQANEQTPIVIVFSG
ncbi:asparagine synthase (glutamine-hydrolyzing) [Candidatus Roizmanbacteria bacterium]|nr:asparagine synthase (glutamine-hydrolyzing) [Candidatus Roizmanbacteria bacterium]